MSARTCPGCGSPVLPEDEFCARCGAALVPACPRCGAPLQAGDQFCPACGTRFGSPPAGGGPAAPGRRPWLAFAAGVGLALAALAALAWAIGTGALGPVAAGPTPTGPGATTQPPTGSTASTAGPPSTARPAATSPAPTPPASLVTLATVLAEASGTPLVVLAPTAPPAATALPTATVAAQPTAQPTRTALAPSTAQPTITRLALPPTVPATAIPPTATSRPAQLARVTKRYGAALRAAPSSDAAILATVACNDVLAVVSSQGGWHQVRGQGGAGAVSGWLGNARVAVGADPAPVDCAGAAVFPIGSTVTAQVASGCLSLREQPSRTAPFQHCVPNGYRYEVINGPIEVAGEDWLGLRSPDTGSGWSPAQFLRPAP